MIILNAHADLMLHALETGDPYPIKMGFYAGNNLDYGSDVRSDFRFAAKYFY